MIHLLFTLFLIFVVAPLVIICYARLITGIVTAIFEMIRDTFIFLIMIPKTYLLFIRIANKKILLITIALLLTNTAQADLKSDCIKLLNLIPGIEMYEQKCETKATGIVEIMIDNFDGSGCHSVISSSELKREITSSTNNYNKGINNPKLCGALREDYYFTVKSQLKLSERIDELKKKYQEKQQ